MFSLIHFFDDAILGVLLKRTIDLLWSLHQKSYEIDSSSVSPITRRLTLSHILILLSF